MNLCEIGLFHTVCGVSKGTRDNYLEISENNVYKSMSGVCGGLHGPPYIFCLLFIKTEKVQEHDQY